MSLAEIFSFPFLVIIPYLILSQRITLLLVLVCASLFTEALYVSLLNFRFTLAGYSGIMLFIMGRSRRRSILNSFRPLLNEYVLILLVGTTILLFFPWEDNYDSFRSLTQRLPGRTLVGLIRVFESLSIAFAFNYFLVFQRIHISYLLRLFVLVALVSFIVSVFDGLFSSIVKRVILGEGNYTPNRVTGLSGEPRSFARSMGLAFLIAYISYVTKELILPRGIILLSLIATALGIIMSMSASALVATVIATVAFHAFYGGINLKGILLFSGMFTIVIFSLTVNREYQSHLASRLIEDSLNEHQKIIKGIPQVMSKLEVFDAAAAGFFYHNHYFLFHGVGPNTINIPASVYLSSYSKGIYKHGINSVPHTGFLQILSRSGILGIILNFHFIFYHYTRAKKSEPMHAYIIIAIVTFSIFVFTASYYAFLGILAGLSYQR